jgi:hypothetical protein
MTYRPPRRGDLFAVRSKSDPYLDEIQVRVDSVVDNGKHLLITGAWQGRDLEFLVIRVGDTQPQPLET